MAFSEISTAFQQIRRGRRANPLTALNAVGGLAASCLRLLTGECVQEPIAFRGTGTKDYSVSALAGANIPFSRPLRSDLFVANADDFEAVWQRYVDAVASSQGSAVLTGIGGDETVSTLYTAIMAYAACIDIHRPGDRGSPGVFLEMLIGPTVACLLDTPEQGSVSIAIEGTDTTETVPTDLTFPKDGFVTLVIPTKISTRERISQAFVHQRILESARPGQYRTALVAVNETNVMVPRDTAPADRLPSVCWVQETLVPGTIALYEKYVAPMAGMYYLDPPARYISRDYPGLPPVARIDKLLLEDLPALTSR